MIQSVIDVGLIPLLLKQTTSSSSATVQKEAAWCIYNATFCGSLKQLQYFLDCNGLESMVNLLVHLDVSTVVVALEAVDNFLKNIEECRTSAVKEQLDKLKNHSNTDIYSHAMAMLDSCYNCCDIQESSPSNVYCVFLQQYVLKNIF